MQDSISLERSPEQQSIYHKYIEKYLQSYPDISRPQNYLPSNLEALYKIKRESEFYRLRDLKDAVNEEIKRIEKQVHVSIVIKRNRESWITTLEIIAEAIKHLLGNDFLSNLRGKFHELERLDELDASAKIQVEVRCHKLGIFSLDGKAEMFEFTEAEAKHGVRSMLQRCDFIRVSKQALC